ncbi:MAG: hypothetical protein U1E76_07335 [Planctomycetota bacterium]
MEGRIPRLDRQRRRQHLLVRTDQDLDGLGHLDGGHQRGQRRQHAGGVAGLELRRVGRIGEHTPQTSALSRTDRQHQAGAGDRAAVDPRQAMLHGMVVDEVARGEVVEAVDDQVDLEQQARHVARDQVIGVRGELRGRVDLQQVLACSLRLGQAQGGIALGIEHLAREIAELDDVAIDQREPAHAGAQQQHRRGRAERSQSDHGHARSGQPLQSRAADRREAGLA